MNAYRTLARYVQMAAPASSKRQGSSSTSDQAPKKLKTHSFFAPASEKAKAAKTDSFWVQSSPPSLLHYSHLGYLLNLPSSLPLSTKGKERSSPAPAAEPVASSSSTSIAAASGGVKVAFFDLDGTLITTRSGGKFPKDGSDWKFWTPKIASLLPELHTKGWRIAIISNQNGLPTSPTGKHKRRDDWKLKIEAIARKFPETPFEVLAAMEKDHFRKPMLGMCDYYLDSVLPSGTSVDLKESYYVGDAAGRAKDHGDGDRKWAENVGIKFVTPETYFLEKEEKLPPLKGFRPTELPPQPFFTPTFTPLVPAPSTSELVLLVGSPGSGKSTFSRLYLEPKGYVRVNQDELKTKARCLNVARAELEREEGEEGMGRRVVVDNTNRNVETRKAWLDLAKEVGVPVRIFLFPPSPESVALAKHNNLYRLYPSAAGTSVPPIALSSFDKAYEPVEAGEGVSEVKTISMGAWKGDEMEKARWETWMS